MNVSENVNERRYRLLSEVVAAVVWSAPGSGEMDSELPSSSTFSRQTYEGMQVDSCCTQKVRKLHPRGGIAGHPGGPHRKILCRSRAQE
jgi:hypothetical protein